MQQSELSKRIGHHQDYYCVSLRHYTTDHGPRLRHLGCKSKKYNNSSMHCISCCSLRMFDFHLSGVFPVLFARITSHCKDEEHASEWIQSRICTRYCWREFNESRNTFRSTLLDLLWDLIRLYKCIILCVNKSINILKYKIFLDLD